MSQVGRSEKSPLERNTGERLSPHKAAKAYPWDWIVLWDLLDLRHPAEAISRFLHKVNRAALGCRYYRRPRGARTTGVRRAWDFFGAECFGDPWVVMLLGDVRHLHYAAFTTKDRRIFEFKGVESLRDVIPARILRQLSFTITGGPVDG